MSRRRMLAMKLRHSYYVRRDLGLSGFCVYCGQTADTFDHVPPISFAADMRLPEFLDLNPSLLPCCRHCNSIIGDSLNLTLSSRREMIEKHIEKRYPSMLKAGALLEGVDFPMTDFRSMLAYGIFNRWQFATTTLIELPPVGQEEAEREVGEADESIGDPNPMDCCMPFPLWCNSWQVSDARRIWWQSVMPEDLQEGGRILDIGRHRELVERFAGEIPEWARHQAASEAVQQKEEEDAFQVQDSPWQDEPDLDDEMDSLIHVEASPAVWTEEMDDNELSRALCALALRNAVGPESFGFRGKRNIREIAEILDLDENAMKTLLDTKGRRSLYTAISDRLMEQIM